MASLESLAGLSFLFLSVKCAAGSLSVLKCFAYDNKH